MSNNRCFLIRFPQEQSVKHEKAKFMPPRQSLLSSLPGANAAAGRVADFENKDFAGSFDTSSFRAKDEEENKLTHGEDDYWTTVFGFPPGEVAQVIAYFQRLGPLDEIRTVDSNSASTTGTQ